MLRSRLENREANFLSLIKCCIYERNSSPYLELLRYAGCAYGDLKRLVAQRGIEAALRKLFEEGVYLTIEEFKGRCPVRRGNAVFDIAHQALRNPLCSPHIWVQSSGSSGAGAPFPVDLAFVRDHAVNTHLTLAAHGGTQWRHAHWGMPGGAAMVNVLEFCKGGTPPVRWFSQVDHHAPGLHPRYRWSARALRMGGRGSVTIPAPEFVALDDPLPIVDWMVQVLRCGGTPHLWTYASAAVRVCEAAWSSGNDLSGARFTMGGEPSTKSRLAIVRRVGGHPIPRYGATETDIIGYACMHPEAPDDMHFLHDRRVVIQTAEPTAGGPPRSTLLFSSLLRTDPLVLLNVSLGDQAAVLERSCGCPMERLGWSTHIHTVRSSEKLTAAGVNFLDADVIRVLEDVLPARFGGAPTDYQLVEKPDGRGNVKLALLVDPTLGPMNTGAVRDTFLLELGKGVDADKVMAMIWRDAALIEVERRPPLRTRSGKILHLHK